jgi:hypothetical protein
MKHYFKISNQIFGFKLLLKQSLSSISKFDSNPNLLTHDKKKIQENKYFIKQKKQLNEFISKYIKKSNNTIKIFEEIKIQNYHIDRGYYK